MDFWDLIHRAEPMGLDEFWGRIEASRIAAKEEGRPQHEALASLLSLEPVEMIASFQNRFQQVSADANRSDIHRVLGGSDDGFHYNISGVIAMGREAYEALLANPGSFSLPVREYEVLEYAAHQAAEEPDRSALRAQAIARVESGELEQALPRPGSSKASPRV